MECQTIEIGRPPKNHTPETQSGDAAVPILGKLRRELLLEISGGERRIGESSEIRSWINKKYISNPMAGDIYRGVLCAKYDLVLAPNDLPSLAESLQSLVKLEKRSLPGIGFVSATLEGKACGVLFQRNELRNGGLVYSATIFSDDTSKTVHVELRACQSNPEPVGSIYSTKGWLRVETQAMAQTTDESTYTSFALRCLAAYHRYQYPVIDPSKVIDRKWPRARPNPYLVRLVADAYKGHVGCTKVKVPMSLIEPRDLDHALLIPNDEIQSAVDALKDGASLELVLYEENGTLIMDDDYLAYLAYRAMDVEWIPAVIVGGFSSKEIKILCSGREELIPPVGVSRIPAESRSLPINKRQMLETKLLPLREKSTPLANLEAKFVRFCRLLSNKSTRERELHQFILRNPEILDCHLASIFSEVQIGRYRADLVLQYRQADKRVVLIELERHNGRMFTKSGRLREKVTHACQQVEDWIEQIRTNSVDVPSWLARSYTPEGAVVIGRSSDLTLEQQEKLFHINSNRLVKVMTYDDLLERMTQLMLTLEGSADRNRLCAQGPLWPKAGRGCT